MLENQLIMPNAAVRRGAPNGMVSTFVYRANADGTVSVRPVTLGIVDGERVAVIAGAAAGDLVVTEGGDRLRDGASIVLPHAHAGAAAAGSSGAGASPAGGRPPGKSGGRRNKKVDGQQ